MELSDFHLFWPLQNHFSFEQFAAYRCEVHCRLVAADSWNQILLCQDKNFGDLNMHMVAGSCYMAHDTSSDGKRFMKNHPKYIFLHIICVYILHLLLSVWDFDDKRYAGVFSV